MTTPTPANIPLYLAGQLRSGRARKAVVVASIAATTAVGLTACDDNDPAKSGMIECTPDYSPQPTIIDGEKSVVLDADDCDEPAKYDRGGVVICSQEPAPESSAPATPSVATRSGNLSTEAVTPIASLDESLVGRPGGPRIGGGSRSFGGGSKSFGGSRRGSGSGSRTGGKYGSNSRIGSKITTHSLRDSYKGGAARYDTYSRQYRPDQSYSSSNSGFLTWYLLSQQAGQTAAEHKEFYQLTSCLPPAAGAVRQESLRLKSPADDNRVLNSLTAPGTPGAERVA